MGNPMTIKRTLTLIVLLALGLSVGLATAGQDNPLGTPPIGRKFIPSSVIFPDQQIPLRFFHDKHIAEEIDCTTCHDSAETSITSSDVLVPVGAEGEEICTNCHDFEEGAAGEPPGACSTCHFEDYKPRFPAGVEPYESQKALNRPAAIDIPVPNLKMNHKVHIDKGIACSRCHGDLSGVQVATRENALPSMNTCLECHDGKTAPDECRTCHISKPDGRLVTRFASGELKPAGNYRNDAHDDAYLQTHAQTAKGEEAYCSNCHQDKFCLECHNGVMKPISVHPNNWILTHPVSARRNMPNCASCHRSQNFCLDCHKRSKVVTPTEFPVAGGTQGFDRTRFGGFHPAGWITGTDGSLKKGSPRGPNHHSYHAQRNIRQCAACHTERTCIGCHSANTLKINPHPPAFGRSGKCKALRATNKGMCSKCHTVVPECI
ncbi:MAG: hypothetical protein ACI9WU_003952 [Myxococcota bacterium]|jgi:hypothetical protein